MPSIKWLFFRKSSSEKHEEILSNLVNGFENTKKKFADKVQKELVDRAEYGEIYLFEPMLNEF